MLLSVVEKSEKETQISGRDIQKEISDYQADGRLDRARQVQGKELDFSHKSAS